MNYKIEGTPNSPVLVLSNSLGSNYSMWDGVMPYLLPFFRVLRYDTRGHGLNKEQNQKTWAIADLANDVIGLLNELNIEKAYFCGLSMGGLIGQELALNYGERFFKIALSNTAAKIGNDERWNERIGTINKDGLEAIMADTMTRWFTDDFFQKNPEKMEQAKAMFLDSDITGYSACCEAIRDVDFRDKLQEISTETLVITGDEDLVTNVEQAEFLVKNIKNSSLKILKARHLASYESPEIFANALLDFFIGEITFTRGTHVRKTVLGEAHVANANQKINAFNSDFQSLISNYAWGEIWTRPGLSKHNRSLITLSMLIALNRPAEFKMHIKAAINNGVSLTEIKEVILQSALYCGLPAANDAIHLAEDVFKQLGIRYE
jgi:3-oxoadipate enol-lactonase / 4-carboxymuconolactone decarboxylase